MFAHGNQARAAVTMLMMGNRSRGSRKAGEMTTIADKAIVPYEDPRWVPILPTRWVAEYDGEIAGSIDRTPRGRYRATNRHGRKVGTFRTLDQARERLALSNSASKIERLDRSRGLLLGGLVAFAATTAAAVAGVMMLLSH